MWLLTGIDAGELVLIVGSSAVGFPIAGYLVWCCCWWLVDQY